MSLGKIGVFNEKTQQFDWYDKEKLEELRIQARKNPRAPYVIQDSMDALKHHGDGKYYTSKKEFDAKSAELGLVPWSPPKDWDSNGTVLPQDKIKAMVEEEVGPDIEQAVERAYNELKYDGVNLSHENRLRAKEINEAYEQVTGKSSVIKGE